MKALSQRIGLCLLVFGLVLSCSKAKLAPEYQVVQPEAGLVKVSVAGMKPLDVAFYTYKYRGRNIDFMVIKFTDRDIRAYLDADYLCYKAKMGYEVVEKDKKLLRCRHHGFDLDLQHPDTWKGNHVPIPLKYEVKDGTVIISEESLQKAYRFFR